MRRWEDDQYVLLITESGSICNAVTNKAVSFAGVCNSTVISHRGHNGKRTGTHHIHGILHQDREPSRRSQSSACKTVRQAREWGQYDLPGISRTHTYHRDQPVTHRVPPPVLSTFRLTAGTIGIAEKRCASGLDSSAPNMVPFPLAKIRNGTRLISPVTFKADERKASGKTVRELIWQTKEEKTCARARRSSSAGRYTFLRQEGGFNVPANPVDRPRSSVRLSVEWRIN